MARRKSIWEKLATEPIWLPFTLAFILFLAWFCFFILPDIITGMFLDAIKNP